MASNQGWNRVWKPAAAIGLALCGFSALAEAQIVKASTTLDWSSFTVMPLAAGSESAPVLSWSSQATTLNGFLPESSTVPDWTSAVSAHVGDTITFSDSSADAGMLRNDGEDSASAVTAGGSWTLRTANFQVAGNGVVRMTVNYAWQLTLDAAYNPPIGSFAYALASLAAETRYDPRGNTNRSAEDQFSRENYSGSLADIGSFQGQGVLQIDLPVQDGDYFYFTAMVGSTANLVASPVPLPPSAALMATGLLGVFAALRRRQG